MRKIKEEAPPNLPEGGGGKFASILQKLSEKEPWVLIPRVRIGTPLPSEGLGEASPLPLSGESEGALQTARHTQRCSNGSEHRDNHINNCFPFFVFHKATILTLNFEVWTLNFMISTINFELLTLKFEVWTLNFMICNINFEQLPTTNFSNYANAYCDVIRVIRVIRS